MKVKFEKLKFKFLYDKTQFSFETLQMYNIENKVSSNNYVLKPDTFLIIKQTGKSLKSVTRTMKARIDCLSNLTETLVSLFHSLVTLL